MKISNSSELPKLLASLRESRFYGDLTLHFKDGEITKLVTEQTQIFDDGRNRNEYRER